MAPGREIIFAKPWASPLGAICCNGTIDCRCAASTNRAFSQSCFTPSRRFVYQFFKNILNYDFETIDSQALFY
jgi:hypothetical protein